jgi:hypothetical protein
VQVVIQCHANKEGLSAGLVQVVINDFMLSHMMTRHYCIRMIRGHHVCKQHQGQ